MYQNSQPTLRAYLLVLCLALNFFAPTWARADVVVVGARDGVVDLFFKQDSDIVLQHCVPYAVVRSRSDCQPLDSQVPVRRVSQARFEQELLEAIRIGVFPASAITDARERALVQRYGAALQAETSREFELRQAVERMTAFLRQYGANSTVEGELQSAQASLRSVTEAAANLAAMQGWIHSFVDGRVGDSAITALTPAADSARLATHLLSSRIQFPGVGDASFVRLPEATFEFGPYGNDWYVHDPRAQIAAGIEMQTSEVTETEWFRVMGSVLPGSHHTFLSSHANPVRAFDSRRDPIQPSVPMTWISEAEIETFLNRLNRSPQAGDYVYRLPTEVEWEYAAVAGQVAPHAGSPTVDFVTWGDQEIGVNASRYLIHSLLDGDAGVPNALGISHMLEEQVMEWTSSSVTDGGHQLHYVRGGEGPSRFIRGAVDRTMRFQSLGFRLVRSARPVYFRSPDRLWQR